jgi:cytochrome c oxidase assembly protein subunit 15
MEATAGQQATRNGAADEARAIRWWLYGLCALVYAMILVGGATRLTDSGLSITEWKPILGIIPPLSEADWQEALAKYREIPEYQLVNKGMSLAEFQFIYWWEWAHRFLGRMIGFAFLLPFLFFWATGRIGRGLMPKLVAMFVLGGLQGALGWYMVASGLTERVDVSQYRLAAHLGVAFLIFGYIYWIALGLRPRAQPSLTRPGQGIVSSAAGLMALIFLQIILGAFVAGIDAGLASDSWPLMHGAFVPYGLGELAPWYVNLFENPLTVQFDHRIAGYLLVVWAQLHAAMIYARYGEHPLTLGAGAIALAALAQMGLGIWTVVAQVPLWLALTHQAGAVVLFALALVHLRQLFPARAPAAA